jgi:Zn-dependent protease
MESAALSEPLPALPPTVEVDESGAASVYEDPALEQQYQDARGQLLNPSVFQRRALLLIGTLVLFLVGAAASSGGAIALGRLTMIVGVLLFHELGHFVGMRAFGYRDVRMFFIPFFGAAVYGQRRGVARWKQAIVLLLGPVPGIAVGVVLATVNTQSGLLPEIASMLLIVNGLNLLPVEPLDGGRLFHLLFFSRNRYLEIVFLVLAAAALLAGWAFFGESALGAIGMIVLSTLPYRWRLARAAREMHLWEPELPANPAELDDEECRVLFAWACDAMPRRWRRKPKHVAMAMEEILDRATQLPPRWRPTLALSSVWGVAIVAVYAGCLLIYVGMPVQWRPYTSSAGGFRVEFPNAPIEKANEPSKGAVLAIRRHRNYLVSWFALPQGPDDSSRWLQFMRDHLLSADGGSTTVLQQDPITFGDTDVRGAYRQADGSMYDARMVVALGRLFTVLAVAPEEESDNRRFLDSFQIVSQ